MDKKRMIIGFSILGIGAIWIVMGLIQLPESGDIFTDNTIGLGIVTMMISAFIFRKMYKLRKTSDKKSSDTNERDDYKKSSKQSD